MKKLLLPLSVLLFLAFFVSCSDDDDDKNKPKIIAVTDFELPAAYKWLVPQTGELYRIDSEEEFERLTHQLVEINAGSGINFEKQTLLVVRGVSNSGIASVMKQLVEDGDYKYTIDIEQNAATVVTPWTVAVTVPKISNDKKIVLDIKCPSCSYDNDPIGEIEMTDYTVIDDDCWEIEKSDSVYRINSDEELWAVAPCINGTDLGTGINFEENTLLLVKTSVFPADYTITKSLIEYSKKYKLEINFTPVYEEMNSNQGKIYTFALVTAKLSPDKPINFNTIAPEQENQ